GTSRATTRTRSSRWPESRRRSGWRWSRKARRRLARHRRRPRTTRTASWSRSASATRPAAWRRTAPTGAASAASPPVPPPAGGGRGRAVMERPLDGGAERGATTAYLQVIGDNGPALALYDRLGFVEHHRYRYLALPD